jgi:hypothetical protein
MIYPRSASLLLTLASVLAASPVWAGSTTGTGGNTGTTANASSLQISDFKMRIRRGDPPVQMTDLDQQTFFNRARCECEEKVQIIVDLQTGAAAKIRDKRGEAKLMVGPSNCLSSDAAIRANSKCWTAATESKLGNISTANSWAVEVSTTDLFSHRGSATATTSAPNPCGTSVAQKVWFFIDADGDTNPDINEGSTGTDMLALTLDGEAPDAPTDLTVNSGNEALEVAWPATTTAAPDLAGYLLFCARGDSLQVFKDSFYDKQYYTKDLLCGGTDTTSSGLLEARSLASATSDSTPAVPVAVPSPIAALDKAYMCSGLISAQTTSHRLTGLQNDAPYVVGLAAVDKSGNASPISTAYYQTPVATRDFYREYRDAGGQAEGGYCTLARSPVRNSALVFGILGLGATWAFRRRRRRRATGASKTLLVLFPLLVAARAEAQTITHDFDDMENLESSSRGRFRSPRNWAFELRFGPYAPNVDSEFSGTSATPHKTVMGTGHHLMSQFELDWELLHAIGTLGIGIQAGYMSETAKAPKADDSGPSGDDTTLRIMPVAALAVYRMDLAAEYWNIPLVPYAKVGLNYTFWSITDGNGNTPEYKGGKGKGGTPGWQAGLGIALQLDFIDPSSARAFDSDTGVNHTYAFFEWNHVAADGLGKSGKLHLGDDTWVAGLMLEF